MVFTVQRTTKSGRSSATKSRSSNSSARNPQRARSKKHRSSTNFFDPQLSEKIDKLFACGVGNDVNLPQLVVVGQQSSGKSSVLEGLTKLPFPRDSGLCTRFATQITSRPGDEARIEAFIVPDKNSSSEHQEKVKEWSREMDEFDEDDFAEIMAEANEVMGVGSRANGHRSAFSRDVFNLVITGPDEGHFSVIDVPGLFKRTETGVTTKEDIQLVDEMVTGYMKNPRSIMLVVVPCNVDIANQDIIEKAVDVDPKGERTLGILTKPDLIDRGAEASVVAIMEGEKHELALGWHLLRNPGQANLRNGNYDRESEERDFFENRAPWDSLDIDKVGVEALQARLQEILEDHLRREFPKVKQDIRQKLTTAENHLQALGPKRQTLLEQSHYLSQTATSYRDIAEAASAGHYSQSVILQNERLRLATMVVTRSDKFAEDMVSYGQAFAFKEDSGMSALKTTASPVISLGTTGVRSGQPDTLPNGDLEPTPYLSRLIETPIDIADLVSLPVPLDGSPTEEDDEWVAKLWHSTRGYEMGTFQAHLIGDMMQRQAQKWKVIAEGYVSDMICAVHHFITSVLTSLIVGERSRQALLSLLMESLKTSYENAFKQTEYLVNLDLKGPPVTHDPAFSIHLENLRQARTREQVEGKAMRDENGQLVVRVHDITAIQHITNEQHTIREIRDPTR